MSTTFKLRLVRGKTCNQVLLYCGPTLVYRPITAVVSLAPLRLTVPTHGIPDSWPARIQSVTTPTEMNTVEGMAHTVFAVDANTLEFNALDGSLWAAFVASGCVVFNEPVDLTGWKARMQVRNKIGGDLLLSLSSDLADGADGIIEVDSAKSSFVLHLTADQTAALPWSSGVYDLEAIKPDGTVLSILGPSPVQVDQEVTVWV